MVATTMPLYTLATVFFLAISSTGSLWAAELPARYLNPQLAVSAPAYPGAKSGEAITNDGALLGRILFYDRGLSVNNLVSCASCHHQASGFDDPNRFSIGFAGKITARNAMGLTNVVFMPQRRFFWDQRASSLAKQVLEPFTDPVEMGLGPGQLVVRVKSRGFYRRLFDNAFGSAQITDQRIASALAQFVRAMVSDRSSFDIARQASANDLVQFSDFTGLQNRGKFLFLSDQANGGAGCSACHEGPAMVMTKPRNNGLTVKDGRDRGLGEVTGVDADDGKFRAPSLRNIAVRAPYMHDGRFANLDAVLAHYSTGIKPHRNLDPQLMDDRGEPIRLQFSAGDRAALVAFLETLTDQQFLNDPRYGDPFRRR